MLTIAFIGFGEVGETFARDFRASGKTRLAAYDILFPDRLQGKGRRDAAQVLDVRIAKDTADAVRGADIVISAVTAASALDVAAHAGRDIGAGQVFLDVNSASPSTKRLAAVEVERNGAHYVEGAVMAAVQAPGFKVPILAGGPHAVETAERLNALGMKLQPVSNEIGRASAMKLCRSIMIKGLEALLHDCSRAAKGWDVEKEVYASLSATYPSIDWRQQVAYADERVATHGIRRAAEMREAAVMLHELGLPDGLSRAIAQVQETGAKVAKEKKLH
jgi:3-hydroxyisobutyrate dehydrogenase-like beta-hydroxyacid dehydrogenase